MGRGLFVKAALTDAARKACRVGIQPAKANSDITTEVNNILSDNNLPTGSATITIQVNGQVVDASTAQRNDKVSVKVALPVSSFFWTSTFFLNSSSVESETIVMMRQG
jgi:hypothetical protein